MNLTTFANSSKSQKPHYLLLGHPVEHSWSPVMHNTALEYYGMDARYYAVDLQNNELNDLAAFLNRDQFLGANITIPYKQIISDYLDEIHREARKIGAVNTIVKKQYRLKGFNTDYLGFTSPLGDYEWDLAGGRAIVFGTGGASRAIVVGLREFGLKEVAVVSRTPAQITSFEELNQVEVISYDEWTSWVEESILIVNATPLGMYPQVGKSPVRDSEKHWLKDRICYDIVYNPIETKFLQQAKEVGSATIGGLEMLIQQANKSFEHWTGNSFPVEIIREKLHERFKN